MFQPIPIFDKTSLNSTEEYIHHASQFLAMVGKNYLPDEPDDSNTNLAFDSAKDRIVGREIPARIKFYISLNLQKWKLEIYAEDGVETLSLRGEKKQDVFNWLLSQMVDRGLDAEKLKYIDHYEIHEHVIDRGHAFPELDQSICEQWLKMRSNANILLQELNTIVGTTSDVRIWPHHFDTGTYYALGENKAIGAGWAIADTLCDNPYLYIYGWDGAKELNYSELPELPIGKWIVTDNWQGAVIEAEELSHSDNQYESSKEFMELVIKFLKEQLN